MKSNYFFIIIIILVVGSIKKCACFVYVYIYTYVWILIKNLFNMSLFEIQFKFRLNKGIFSDNIGGFQ